MLKRIVYVVTMLVFALSMIAAAPVSALGVTRLLKGTVVAIDTKTRIVTVAPLLGKPVRVKVTLATLVKRQGKASTFARLRVGDKTSLNYNTANSQAVSIDDTVSAYEIHGTVESVDTVANTIVVASEEGGSSVKLNVAASTVILRNHVAATLADLVVGDKVEAKYNSATMLASLIKTEVEDGDLTGSVVAVTANSVTVHPASGANVVLKVVASTVFLGEDVVIDITNLRIGDLVEAEYDSTTLVASKIEVNH